MVACGTYVYESATTTCPDANYATLKYFLGYRRPLLLLITPSMFNSKLAARLGSTKQMTPYLFRILLSCLHQLFGQMRPGNGVWRDMEMG